ncbi:unnamed protein product [Pleuronectes platessa]|uniref:Uncharacterized protein n=1 Tax=Pleuronectes platessa TaxID=8262 RepID=A0A9N7YTF3_PLEPL|nr:unnamed protein product [Pleuronectes platessa]
MSTPPGEQGAPASWLGHDMGLLWIPVGGGEMPGSSTSQRERRRRAERLPGGEAGDPPSAKYAEVEWVSIGQELNPTEARVAETTPELLRRRSPHPPPIGYKPINKQTVVPFSKSSSSP